MSRGATSMSMSLEASEGRAAAARRLRRQIDFSAFHYTALRTHSHAQHSLLSLQTHQRIAAHTNTQVGRSSGVSGS